MKKGIVMVLLLVLLLCGCQQSEPQPKPIIENLGIPTLEQYSNDLVSRCPWDMVVWNNKLYVGAGDYGNNTGPVECMAYDLQTATWENTGTLTEESIARFCVVDGTLMIPGIDSTVAGHLLGEYYYLQEYEWQNKRTLPGGIHCFDLVSFEDKIFAGLGVTGGEYPVAISSDNGQTFTQVPFYKDGQPLETTKDAIRVYDLVVLENTLYAFYIAENNQSGKSQDFECCIYEYKDNQFVYKTIWDPYLKTTGSVQIPFSAKTVFDDRLFIATGYLYKATQGLEKYEPVSFEEGMVTFDLLTQDGYLYALNNYPCSDGTFDISVWRTDSGEAFEEVFSFNYPTPALSFALYNETYYIGIGNMSLEHDTNGTILAVTKN